MRVIITMAIYSADDKLPAAYRTPNSEGYASPLATFVAQVAASFWPNPQAGTSTRTTQNKAAIGYKSALRQAAPLLKRFV
jgi:hypothetical protein